MLSQASLILLALAGVNAIPQITINGQEVGSSTDSSCSGTVVFDYCCDGSVLSPSGNFANNNNDDVSGLICCVGDPEYAFNNGPSFTSCTAGSAVPLTEAASATAAAGAGSASASASAVPSASDVVSVSMSSVAAGSSAANSAQASATGSGSSGAGSGSQGTAASASSEVLTQSSAGGAAAVMATLAPALGGAVVAVAGLL